MTHDEAALLALTRGHITADPATGAVQRRDGQRAEHPRPDGYGLVSVSRPGHGAYSVGAHRIIWLAAHGPIPGGLRVNHVNMRTWDNRLTNLELVTPAGNWHHGHGNEYVSIGGNIDPTWLDGVRQLLGSGDLTREDLDALRGEVLSSPHQPYSSGPAVQARSPARISSIY